MRIKSNAEFSILIAIFLCSGCKKEIERNLSVDELGQLVAGKYKAVMMHYKGDLEIKTDNTYRETIYTIDNKKIFDSDWKPWSFKEGTSVCRYHGKIKSYIIVFEGMFSFTRMKKVETTLTQIETGWKTPRIIIDGVSEYWEKVE